MPDFSFIVNPAAGKGSAARMREFLERVLRRRGVRHELHLTNGPGHATELARAAGSPVVVAIGGDGTVNEVANGIIGSGKHLGVIPAGSGNDFIKSVNVPRSAAGALERLLNGSTVSIDVGSVSCSKDDRTERAAGRYFVNGVGIGFDAAVAVRTRQIKHLTGVPLYLAAVFQTLGRFRAPDFTIRTDDREVSGRRLLIAVGNGTCAGGGFYLTPEALVNDGLFDVCVIDDIPIRTILRLLPTVLWGGHKKAPEAKFWRAKHLSISSRDRFYVHADGEIVGDSVTSVHIQIHERSLMVVGGSVQGT